MKIILQITLLSACINVYAQDELTNSGNFKICAGASVTFFGNVTNNGSFVDLGQGVTMSGSNSQSVGGSSGISFYNLTINKSANNLTLSNSIDITNTCSFANGLIVLGANNLTIASTGSISGGSSSSFVVTDGAGLLRQQNIGSGGRTGSVFFPVGHANSSAAYSPVTLDNSTGTADRFDVKACNYISTGGTCSGSTQITSDVVSKTWTINEATAGGSNATITLQWNAADELTGFDRTDCFISHHDGTNWGNIQSGGAASGADPYTRSVTGVSNFSPFGVGKVGSPLPIALILFEAKLNNKAVDLHWNTASEINNDYFTVERSADAIHFEEIKKVQGAGNSNTILNYYTKDTNPLSGLFYYRLKQTDFNGKTSYSSIVEIDNADNVADFNIFQNPSNGFFEISSNKNQISKMEIYNVLGEKVYQSMTSNNLSIINLDVPAGTYFLRVSAPSEQVQAGQEMISKKIIIQ